MRIRSEQELLNQVTRARIIIDIKGAENQLRKADSYKRHQCYKDNTKSYVIESLLSQFDAETVQEMKYSISNISFSKKIVDKLARVYSNGVERKLENDIDTEKLNNIEKIICLNTNLKLANRLLKLNRNDALYIKPCPVLDESGSQKWTIRPQTLAPYLYDAVEDFYDRTNPMCFILSNYKPVTNLKSNVDGGQLGNRVDEKIADTPADNGINEAETYIFWSKNYHFTCLESGEIITDINNPDNVNPFGMMPIVNFAIDQDDAFWSTGGQDITDGCVMLNNIITHANHVSITQGYGQAFMTGENLPSRVKVGPTKIIKGEYKKDEQAQPTFEYVSSNPQIDSIRALIEAYLALLLTTNNLSTSGISAQLNGNSNSASGIALIIDKAESLEDVQDQRQLFLDKEPVIWKIINNIISVYKDSMIDELKNNLLPEGFEKNLYIRFIDPTPIMSEQEKLQNMKLRLELGIDGMIDIIMRDNPGMKKEQAEDKLKSILEENIKYKMSCSMVDESQQEQSQDIVQESNQEDMTDDESNKDNNQQ